MPEENAGLCERCGANNLRTSVICRKCGSRLAWSARSAPPSNPVIDTPSALPPTPKRARPRDPSAPGKALLAGIVLWGLAVVMFFVLSGMETSGGSVRIPWFLALAYDIGGKWAVSTLLALVGSFFIYVAMAFNND